MNTLRPEPIDQITRLFQIVKDIKTPSFIHILNYSNDKSNQTEIANYIVNIGITYENAKKEDSRTLVAMESTNRLQEVARRELLVANEYITEESIKRSQAQINAYNHIIPNIKQHKENGCVYITGFVVSKQIIKPGIYRPEYVSPIVREKNAIRKDHLKATKYRQFKINKISMVRLMGQEIIIEL